MDTNELEKRVSEAVMEYISDEENYGDNAQLVIDPANGEVTLTDGDDDIDDALDHYDVMDLLRMDSDGKWSPDTDAIASVAADY